MLKVNSVSFRGDVNTQAVSNNVTAPKNEVQTDKKMSTKTKVAIGTGLAALAAVGIYIATKGRAKTNVKVNTNTVSDIVEEGIGSAGCKYKKIKDGANKNWKEYITYYKDGKEKTHTWYDCSIQDTGKSITKQICYAKNGDIYSITSYMAPGKPSKYIEYNSSEDIKKYGYKICSGIKYSPNGNPRFLMVHLPGNELVTAEMYDKGNLIKTRNFIVPKVAKQAQGKL